MFFGEDWEIFKLQFIGLLGFLCKRGLGAKPPDPNTVAGSPEVAKRRRGSEWMPVASRAAA